LILTTQLLIPFTLIGQNKSNFIPYVKLYYEASFEALNLTMWVNIETQMNY